MNQTIKKSPTSVAIRTVFCIDYCDIAGLVELFESHEERASHIMIDSVLFDLDVPADADYFQTKYLVDNAAYLKLYQSGGTCRPVTYDSTDVWQCGLSEVETEDIPFI